MHIEDSYWKVIIYGPFKNFLISKMPYIRFTFFYLRNN